MSAGFKFNTSTEPEIDKFYHPVPTTDAHMDKYLKAYIKARNPQVAEGTQQHQQLMEYYRHILLSKRRINLLTPKFQKEFADLDYFLNSTPVGGQLFYSNPKKLTLQTIQGAPNPVNYDVFTGDTRNIAGLTAQERTQYALLTKMKYSYANLDKNWQGVYQKLDNKVNQAIQQRMALDYQYYKQNEATYKAMLKSKVQGKPLSDAEQAKFVDMDTKIQQGRHIRFRDVSYIEGLTEPSQAALGFYKVDLGDPNLQKGSTEYNRIAGEISKLKQPAITLQKEPTFNARSRYHVLLEKKYKNEYINGQMQQAFVQDDAAANKKAQSQNQAPAPAEPTLPAYNVQPIQQQMTIEQQPTIGQRTKWTTNNPPTDMATFQKDQYTPSNIQWQAAQGNPSTNTVQGNGTVTYQDRVVSGQFQNGRMQNCTIQYKDGATFQGTFDGQGRASGEAQYKSASALYSGPMLNNQFDTTRTPNQMGTLIDPRNQTIKYVGQFRAGLREGAGEQIFADRTSWRGNWKGDYPSGVGVYKDASGKTFNVGYNAQTHTFIKA